MRKQLLVILLIALVATIFACSPEPETVEVEVEATREVTREVVVTVEVTRLVEVTPVAPTSLPAASFGSVECDDYTAAVRDLSQQWSDAFDLASSTARVSLGDRVAEMQEIRREMSRLTEPGCASQIEVQDRLVEMMDAGIEFFTEFMAQNDISAESAQYAIAVHLTLDALEALYNHSTKLPNRIHYYALGTTGFSLRYADENGELITPEAGPTERFGFDDMPVVFTALLPEGETAKVTLFNPTSTSGDLTCFILLNGEAVATETQTAQTTCEFEIP